MGRFASLAISARRIRSSPDRGAIAQPDRGHAAARVGFLWVKESVGDVDSLAVYRNSPEDAAARGPLADLLLPNHLALMIRIERPNQSGLIASDKKATATGQFSKDRRGAKIEVRGVRVGVDGGFAIRTAATGVPDIVFRLLTKPSDLAALHIHGHDGIRHGSGWRREVVARPNVERVSFCVESRCIPHRAAGGAHDLRTRTVSPAGLRRFDNRVGLPDLFAGGGIERHDTSAKSAAGIVRISDLGFLAGGYRHV